ncbi:MAG: hypothetical protein JHC33_07030 [Ignisphaera sp.]|nr:hypothetical protein [Ignisphaera sp.]
MDNKIKHYNATQNIPDVEFKHLLRGESPYYGNLNRAPYSAYSLATSAVEVLAWGGTISILQPIDQIHEFVCYEVARISDGEVLVQAAANDPITSRYGIVVAEAELDAVTGLRKNIVVCTFCPNFVYPSAITTPVDTVGDALYLSLNAPYLSNSHTIAGLYSTDRKLGIKTGTRSIFFSGTANIFG